MGRKGNWFSAVKRVFNGSDSRKQQKQKHHRSNSKVTCFGHYEPPEPASEEAAIAVVPSLPPRRDVKPNEAENEQSKHAFSLVLATAVAAGAAVAAAQAAADVARLTTMSPSRYPGKTKEEIAAIKIQTAFRGYLARRSLRALRGLARLKTLIQGQSVKRQAATTLQCMQTFSRLQSQILVRRIRMSEENQALQRQLQQKREKELDKLQAAVGEKWDDSLQSKEQIEAKLWNRQVAAMRREKAKAYSLSHQQTWRNPSKSANATFMDPNDPHWGWNWLERWMAARPWEGQSTMNHNGHASAKSAASHTMSVGEITKFYSQRDQNHDSKNCSPGGQKASRLRSLNNSPSTLASKAPSNGKAKASSPKGSSWGGDDDSKSMFSINTESNRRHSIAVSPVRDDESLASSPTFPSHTASKRVAKARSLVQSPSGVHRNNGTPENGAAVSAKKRPSFPASPASSRRHSVPTKMGMVSSKSVATIPEEKEKVKVSNGGSR